MSEVMDRFVEALKRLERDGDLDNLVSLFSDKCTVGNVLALDSYRGSEGARQFWQHYRDTFREISSEFRCKISGEGCCALEWTSRGTLINGTPFNYTGVSVIETEGNQIKRFDAYFDSRCLTTHLHVDEGDSRDPSSYFDEQFQPEF